MIKRNYSISVVVIVALLFLLPHFLPRVGGAASGQISGDDAFHVPEWVKNAVFYQIFPERFRNGDSSNDPREVRENWILPENTPPQSWWGWFGGDLQGVKEKAFYLADLGVTAIYLNPIFDSTDYHGYSVIDYKMVNRYFGAYRLGSKNEILPEREAGIQAFRDMMTELDKYGIKVVLDGVFNHCSTKSMWFDKNNDFPTDGAYESQDSPWYEWFTFRRWPDDYECWEGHRALPEVNETEEFKKYVYKGGYTLPDSDPEKKSVITFWDELGVDGWRLDCGPDVGHEFWKEFRTCYKQLNPEGYVVGECWQHAGLWLQGDEWDGVMNYLWHDAVLSWARGGEVSSLDYKLRGIQGSYPEEAWRACLNLLGSHDTGRALTRLMDDKTRMKLAVIFQMTYPGVPCIYYGDEVGLTGGGDPECRKTYPWGDLGGNPDMQMFEHHKKLIGIRMRYPVLRAGSLKTLKVDDDAHIYVLGRKLGNQVAVLIYNNGSSAENVTVDLGELAPAGTKFIDVLNENREYITDGRLTLTTDGMWANILIGTSEAREGVGMLPIFGVVIGIAAVTVLVFILRKK